MKTTAGLHALSVAPSEKTSLYCGVADKNTARA